MGGLTAGLVLRDIGCQVDIYERSRRPLIGLGAGIVAHPASVRYIVENELADLRESTAEARWVRYLDRAGLVTHEQACRYRFSSYHALYRELAAAFGSDRYHLENAVVGFRQSPDGVIAELADGTTVEGDMLIGADGIHSTCRRLLLPEVEREYAGYVAWRGAIDERDLTPATVESLREAIIYFLAPNTHILAYPIPGPDGSVEPGHRSTNWIWYRNIESGSELEELMTDRAGVRQEISMAPGAAQSHHLDALREQADEVLAPPLAEMVRRTAQPFVQVVFDLAVPQMAFDRICLIGDAACALRPHAAVGTAKAAEDSWKLAEAMEECDLDVREALRRWEPGQLELIQRALERTREAGERLQFENSWQVGEPLAFGLYEQGDSSFTAVR